MGRPKTTGRFETRAELVDRVHHLNERNGLSVSGIARSCGISPVTADTILEHKEWETLTDADYDVRTPETDVDVHLDSRSLNVCGAGYDFPLYRLHLPDIVKRELELL